ncbi:MAG: glycoside hydrolase family 97 protein [Ferruginibacter sp.]|nr:glycoside hydrolase family 97 protein [Ferruginibacter sp.]
MRLSSACLLFSLLLHPSVFGQKLLSSPNGKIQVKVELGEKLTYSVAYDNKVVLLPSPIDMLLAGGNLLSSKLAIKSSRSRSVTDTIFPPVAEKRSRIFDQYNELTIQLKNNFDVIFRAYNDGVAYRIHTNFKDSITIINEIARFNFPANPKLYYPLVDKRADADSFHTSFESVYQQSPLDSISNNALFFNPVLVAPTEGPKIVITESDIEDYPGMFHRGTSSNSIIGCFAGYPLKETINESEFPQLLVTDRAPFIAVTKGTRSFPWRVLAIAAKDADLPGNDIVYRLGSPSRVKNTSWIRPGKGTDEWIIGINLFNIPFKAGINTVTYKYYIDFAKRFGFDRIMLDAGWSDYKDLFKISPQINMEEIAAYAKANGIRLSLWTLALTLDRQLDSALTQFKQWGVDYIMTDFMDRDDQKMVNFYYRIAEACAKREMMIMFHGAYKPAGFTRTFPNALTREGVLGAEFNIGSDKATPGHDLLIPFIRMVAGPMDYEPGLLDNATKQQFRPIGEKVMSMGTRCHQLAMFVVYDNPMQIFSGNPSQGLLEPAFMKLLGSIPTTWDETIIPEAKLGEYIITARRKGHEWFIAGMTDWSSRKLELSLDFLPAGTYGFEQCVDGINAEKYPADYIISKGELASTGKLALNLVPGGGYLIRLQKK